MQSVNKTTGATGSVASRLIVPQPDFMVNLITPRSSVLCPSLASPASSLFKPILS
jgi:hypothetical protein